MVWIVAEVAVAWTVLVTVVVGMLRAAAHADRAAADAEQELVASLRRLAIEQLHDTPGLAAPRAGAGRPFS